MKPIVFDYLGHSVVIAPQHYKGAVQYWFIVDGHPVTHVSNCDTAKRLATRFIDVITDADFPTNRQGTVNKPANC